MEATSETVTGTLYCELSHVNQFKAKASRGFQHVIINVLYSIT